MFLCVCSLNSMMKILEISFFLTTKKKQNSSDSQSREKIQVGKIQMWNAFWKKSFLRKEYSTKLMLRHTHTLCKYEENFFVFLFLGKKISLSIFFNLNAYHSRHEYTSYRKHTLHQMDVYKRNSEILRERCITKM